LQISDFRFVEWKFSDMGNFAPGFEEFALSDSTIDLLKRRDDRDLLRAKRQLQMLQGRHSRRRTIPGLGELTHRMPPWYYHKLAAWGRLHGYGRNGYAVHDDPALLRDIIRNNPELRIISRSERIGSGYGRGASAVDHSMPVRDVTGAAVAVKGTAQVLEDRPGRFRKVYPEFTGRKAS
jgi:hypothetical protein